MRYGLTCLVLGIAAAAAVKAEVALEPKAELQHRIFEPLREQLKDWVFTAHFGVTIGNASGPLFEYEHGNFSLKHSKCELASTSKWPLAMMFVGLVADGHIESLDSKANEYVEWWTKDPTDPKSNITLRHLLSFTSGFGNGAPGQENETATCMDDPSKYPDVHTYDECAKQIYHDTNLTGTPGYTYTYNSVHLQLAGAMALGATNKRDIQEIIHEYLLVPYGMNSTTCVQPTRIIPELAICLVTTGNDYGRFLEATLTHSVLPAELIEESEKDYTPFLSDSYSLYGNYGFGHFLECYDSVAGFTDACKHAQIHVDPGALGYYPLIDRANNYYMQIVANEGGIYYPRSGIPEYLRFLVKPLADAILEGENPKAAFSHHTPRFNGLSLVDINYIAGCYAHPETCL